MKVYKDNYKKIKLPVTERLSKEILTLPAMEYVSSKHINELTKTIKLFFSKNTSEKY